MEVDEVDVAVVARYAMYSESIRQIPAEGKLVVETTGIVVSLALMPAESVVTGDKWPIITMSSTASGPPDVVVTKV